jgi:hypothetical protein
MPSARVLVRFPLHVILRVEAAFASTIVAQKEHNNAHKCQAFRHCDHSPNDLSETAMVAAMGLQTDLTVNQGVRALVMPIGSRRGLKPLEHTIFNVWGIG